MKILPILIGGGSAFAAWSPSKYQFLNALVGLKKPPNPYIKPNDCGVLPLFLKPVYMRIIYIIYSVTGQPAFAAYTDHPVYTGSSASSDTADPQSLKNRRDCHAKPNYI